MPAFNKSFVTAAVLVCLALTASVFAQQGGVSAIAGTVRDTSGAVLPGVTRAGGQPGTDRESARSGNRRAGPA